MNDASLAWCLDHQNHQAVARAAISLGLKDTMASISLMGIEGNIWLDIEADAVDDDPLISEETYGKVWREQVTAWRTQQPDTFNRACLAAFEGRS